MGQLIMFTELVSMFDNDTVLELYTKGDNEPWFANKAYLLHSISGSESISIPMDKLKISSKFAGYTKSHNVITFEEKLPIIEHKKEWWDRLRLATPNEILDLTEEVIKEILFTKIKESCNEVAIAAVESGQCDSAIKGALTQIDYDGIVMEGCTKLDIINARSNPSDSNIRKLIIDAVNSAMQSDDGKTFQDILFG